MLIFIRLINCRDIFHLHIHLLLSLYTISGIFFGKRTVLGSISRKWFSHKMSVTMGSDKICNVRLSKEIRLFIYSFAAWIVPEISSLHNCNTKELRRCLRIMLTNPLYDSNQRLPTPPPPPHPQSFFDKMCIIIVGYFPSCLYPLKMSEDASMSIIWNIINIFIVCFVFEPSLTFILHMSWLHAKTLLFKFNFYILWSFQFIKNLVKFCKTAHYLVCKLYTFSIYPLFHTKCTESAWKNKSANYRLFLCLFHYSVCLVVSLKFPFTQYFISFENKLSSPSDTFATCDDTVLSTDYGVLVRRELCTITALPFMRHYRATRWLSPEPCRYFR